MTTIKQLADELGVSKQAIRKRINQLPPTDVTTGANRIILISDEAAQKIRDSINQLSTNVTTNQVPTVDTLITMMQKELDSKNATIESQSRQLEQAQQSIQDLTAALASAQLSAQQAQALHAGTLHKQLQEGEPEAAPVVVDEVEPGEKENKPGIFARIFGKR